MATGTGTFAEPEPGDNRLFRRAVQLDCVSFESPSGKNESPSKTSQAGDHKIVTHEVANSFLITPLESTRDISTHTRIGFNIGNRHHRG